MSYFIFQLPLWGVCLTALMLCLITDVRDRIIPNEYVGIIAAGGLALAALSWPGQIWISVLIAIVLLVVLGFFCRLRLLGGGDAKLISAVTLLTPPASVGQLLVAIAFAGGILSCLYLAARWLLRRTALEHFPARQPFGVMKMRQHKDLAQNVPRDAPRTASDALFARECARIAAGKPMPYGVAIVCGAVFHFIVRFS